MEIKYSKANKDDLAAVAALSGVLSVDDKTKTVTQIQSETETTFLKNLLWVAKYQDQVIGFGVVELFGDDHRNFPNSIFISQLFVDSKFRRQGIGAELMKRMLSDVYPDKYTYFSVTYDPREDRLTKYYETFGFRFDGHTKAGNVRMVKQRIKQ